MSTFWKSVGKALAHVAVGAARAAAWASQHPEILQILSGILSSTAK